MRALFFDDRRVLEGDLRGSKNVSFPSQKMRRKNNQGWTEEQPWNASFPYRFTSREVEIALSAGYAGIDECFVWRTRGGQ